MAQPRGSTLEAIIKIKLYRDSADLSIDNRPAINMLRKSCLTNTVPQAAETIIDSHSLQRLKCILWQHIAQFVPYGGSQVLTIQDAAVRIAKSNINN
jgi:hypothetical protein